MSLVLRRSAINERMALLGETVDGWSDISLDNFTPASLIGGPQDPLPAWGEFFAWSIPKISFALLFFEDKYGCRPLQDALCQKLLLFTHSRWALCWWRNSDLIILQFSCCGLSLTPSIPRYFLARYCREQNGATAARCTCFPGLFFGLPSKIIVRCIYSF